MYAIVDIAGQQFKVTKNQRVFVHRLTESEGSNVEFNKVLLIDNEGKISVGKPVVEGFRVAAKVLNHVKGDKVIVFKKKRRKGYEKKNGHRQFFSEILIQGILGKGETLSAEETAKPKKKAAPKAEAAEVSEEKPVKKAAVKKAAPKKTKKSE